MRKIHYLTLVTHPKDFRDVYTVNGVIDSHVHAHKTIVESFSSFISRSFMSQRPAEAPDAEASRDVDSDDAGYQSPGGDIVAEWDGPHDPLNPVNWSDVRKWRITGFACFMCFMVGLNALSIAGAAAVINEEFGVSDASFPNSYWTVTAWNGGAALFPLVILPLLEDFSVRVGYMVCHCLLHLLDGHPFNEEHVRFDLVHVSWLRKNSNILVDVH